MMNQIMQDVLMWALTISLSIVIIGSSIYAVIAIHNMIKADNDRWKDHKAKLKNY